MSIAIPAKVHSEYTEIFDTGRTLPVNMSPPKLPSRARPQSHKPVHTSLSNNTTPNTTPISTPITHHKIMVKSDSSSSNEIFHSITSSKGGDDDVIDATVYDKPWESRVPKSPHWNRSPKKQASSPGGKSETQEKEGTEAWSVSINVENAKDFSLPTSRVIQENRPLSNPISPDLYPSLKPLKTRLKPRSLTRTPTPIDRLEPLPKSNDLPTKNSEDKPTAPPSGPPKAINIYSVIENPTKDNGSKQAPPKPAQQNHATKWPSLEAETISSDKEEELSSSESATSSPAPTANSDSLKRMKHNSSFGFTSGALLYNAIERMLEDEGIDLVSPPYSSSVR